MAKMTIRRGRCSRLSIETDSPAVLRVAADLFKVLHPEIHGVSPSELFRTSMPRTLMVSHKSRIRTVASTRWGCGYSSIRSARINGAETLGRELTARVSHWLRTANKGCCAICAIQVHTCR